MALSRRVNSAAAAESGALDNKQIHSKRHPLGCAFCGLVPACALNLRPREQLCHLLCTQLVQRRLVFLLWLQRCCRCTLARLQNSSVNYIMNILSHAPRQETNKSRVILAAREGVRTPVTFRLFSQLGCAPGCIYAKQKRACV